MNYLLFDREIFNAHYNCSYYNINIQSIEERTNVVYGIGLLVLSTIFLCLYAPLIIVLWQSHFQKESCYRLMSIMVIIDIFAIVVSGIMAGYFSIVGAVYCSCPWTMLFFGTIGLFVWIAESDLAIILALNRCMCIISANKTSVFFNGNKTYIWILIAFLHASIITFTTNGIIYSSIFGVWIFNPHVGYPQTGFNISVIFSFFYIALKKLKINRNVAKIYRYANKYQPFHNIGVAFLLAFFYIIFAVNLIQKNYYTSENTVFSKKQKPIFLQVLIVSILNFFIAILYVYEQFFPTPKFLMAASEVGWLCIHGMPSVIYLFLNKSIRKRVIKLVFKVQYTASISPNVIIQDGQVINSNPLHPGSVSPTLKTM